MPNYTEPSIIVLRQPIDLSYQCPPAVQDSAYIQLILESSAYRNNYSTNYIR